MSDTEHKNAFRGTIIFPVVLLLLTASLYVPQLLSGRTSLDDPDKMDITLQWMPGYMDVADSYREGFFPLWNPEVYLGMPWAAYAHSASLYPFSAIFFSITNYFDGGTVSMLFHSLLMALGAYLFLKELERSHVSSFLGALVFVHSGPAFHFINQYSTLHFLGWLPWFLLFMVRIHKRPRVLEISGLWIAMSMAVMGGDAESMVYALMFSYLVILLVLSKGGMKTTFRTLTLFTGALVLAFVGTMMLSIPVLELTGLSVRSPGSRVAVTMTSQIQYWYLFIPHLLAPFKYYSELRPLSDFNHGLTPFYIGLFPLALFVSALINRDRDSLRWFVVLALLLGYLAIMAVPWLAPLTAKIPLLGSLASRGRMLIEVQIIIIVIIASELDRIAHASPKGLRLALLLLVMGVIVLSTAPASVLPASRLIFVTALVVPVGLLLFFYRRTQLMPRAFYSAAAVAIIFDITVLALFAVPRNEDHQYRLPEGSLSELSRHSDSWRFMPFEELLGQGDEMPALSSGIRSELKMDTPIGFMRLPPSRSFEYLSLANPDVMSDPSLMFTGAKGERPSMDIEAMTNPANISPRFLRLMDLASVRWYAARDTSLKFADKFPLLTPNAFPENPWDGGSISGTGAEREMEVQLPYRTTLNMYVHPGSKLAFGMEAKSNDNPGVSTSMEGDDFIIRVSEGSGRVEVDLSEVKGTKTTIRLFISGSGKAVLSDLRVERKDMPLRLVERGKLDVYEKRDAFPRAFFADHVKVLPPDGPLQDALRSGELDLRKTVLLERPDPSVNVVENVPSVSGAANRVPVKIEHKDEEVKLSVNAPVPGYVVLTDTYYPGWRARLGGRELPVLPAYLAFRSIFVPEGKADLVLTYEPASFRIGLWVSVSVTLFMLCLILFISIRRFRRPDAA